MIDPDKDPIAVMDSINRLLRANLGKSQDLTLRLVEFDIDERDLVWAATMSAGHPSYQRDVRDAVHKFISENWTDDIERLIYLLQTDPTAGHEVRYQLDLLTEARNRWEPIERRLRLQAE